MKRIIRLVALVCVLAAGGAAVWYWLGRHENRHAAGLVVFGNVDVRQVELAINGNERIGKVLVEEGDHIEKGQLLAVLELERFNLSVARAKAQVEAQKQVVARLEAGSRKEEIAKSKADLAVARAATEDAGKTYRRRLSLLEDNAVSQQDVDDAKAALDSARAQENSLKATLDLALAGPRQEDIDEAKAWLKRYEVELAQAEHDYEDAHLYAPADGVVQERILEVGDMASPQKPIYTIALTNPVWVRAYVSEPDLGKIFEGMKAIVTTDSFPEKEYEGWVGFISPTAEFTPKPVETRELRTKLVYQIRVFVRNPNNELRLGMPATVNIPLGQPKPDRGNEPDTEARSRSSSP